MIGLDVQHVGMAAQEVEHAAYLLLALARAQIVDDTDSQRRLHADVDRGERGRMALGRNGR